MATPSFNDPATDLATLCQPYLARILAAPVYDLARETALQPAPRLSRQLGCDVWLKREDQQPVFSFKLRGAYAKMRSLSAAQLRGGVVTASAGNHAQGVALAASHLGARAVIVVPATTPQVKQDAILALGGTAVSLIRHGACYSDADAHATQVAQDRGLTSVPAFDDPDVIAGQGTVGLEILRQHAGPLHAVFVPIGGGSLAAGVAACIKAVRPRIRVIGVQTHESCAMARSIEAGERIELEHVGLFCDGTAVRRVGAETFRLCRRLLDDIVLVDNDAVCAAIRDIFLETRSIVEPAGALALAGLAQYTARHDHDHAGALVVVTSGANVNFEGLGDIARRAAACRDLQPA
ncbi:threonine ammonia-lyase, biosynthetic [Verticiella sediminum]|uniref:L-threonine dehydratase n=1 Tax=Verticiella sediminum TaxID=1247510 RepID=A0A556AY83_9BURK|nr:threonine ammonia-lyase, biosynthetic [Verticiella sediminum]